MEAEIERIGVLRNPVVSWEEAHVSRRRRGFGGSRFDRASLRSRRGRLLGDYDELYPDVPGESWEPYRALYPELFAGETWRLPCNSFLIRSAGTTILVDTGVGPPGLWD